MAREGVGHTFLVAGVLCVVCSLLVSAAAVGLRPFQRTNRTIEKQKNVLMAAGMLDAADGADRAEVERLFGKFEVHIVDLETGQFVTDSSIADPATFDQQKASKDLALSVAIDADKDISGIKRREKYSFVYVLKDDQGRLQQIVLPVYGKGLWSTLYGFLSLDSDLTTIHGLTFYSHAETPGLGGEVDNPQWKEQWKGKKAFDDSGSTVKAKVARGRVDPSNSEAIHQVDGLSGATITSNGVTRLVQYWLGEDAFGPLLKRLRDEQK